MDNTMDELQQRARVPDTPAYSLTHHTDAMSRSASSNKADATTNVCPAQTLSTGAESSTAPDKDVTVRVVHTGSAVEDHTDADAPAKNAEYVVILRFDDRYLRTMPGILRFFQVVLSVVALVCLTSSGGDRGGYLRLPLSWHLRAFVFTCVAGMLMSLFTLFLNVSGAITMLPINWPFFDTIVYGFLGFMYLFTSSLVASAIDFYQQLDGHVSSWTIDQLIASVVFGYICLVLFGWTAFTGYQNWKGAGQFRRYRFRNSQRSTISSASAEVA